VDASLECKAPAQKKRVRKDRGDYAGEHPSLVPCACTLFPEQLDSSASRPSAALCVSRKKINTIVQSQDPTRVSPLSIQVRVRLD
jgi:hypothetical protein